MCFHRWTAFENVNCNFFSEGKENRGASKRNGLFQWNSSTKLHPKNCSFEWQRRKNVKALEERSNWKFELRRLIFVFSLFRGIFDDEFFSLSAFVWLLPRLNIEIFMFNSCFVQRRFTRARWVLGLSDWSAESFVESLKLWVLILCSYNLTRGFRARWRSFHEITTRKN